MSVILADSDSFSGIRFAIEEYSIFCFKYRRRESHQGAAKLRKDLAGLPNEFCMEPIKKKLDRLTVSQHANQYKILIFRPEFVDGHLTSWSVFPIQ